MSEKIKLHLGCGNKYIPGYIHIDVADYEHIDYNYSIDHLPMFEDNSVDYIYCCHALEYFDRTMGNIALKEWFRILKPDSILRIAVPDFESIIHNYLKSKNIESQGILGPLYGKIIIKKETLSGDSFNKSLYHKTAYDYKSLRKILKDIGYRRIKKYDWRSTEHCFVDDFAASYIPHMNKENGLLISLNIEARK